MKRYIILLSLLLHLSACNDWIEVPAPDTDLVRTNVFEDDATAMATMAGVYGQLSSYSGFANGTLSLVMGAYTDELVSYAPAGSSSAALSFYLNNVVPVNATVTSIWNDSYSVIFKANMIIEGLSASNKVSTSAKNQLTGEALFLRAFCQFYLVNLFGDVPLITTSDYRVNATTLRKPAADIYSHIIADLLQAKNLLSDAYPSAGRVRANKGAAIALLSRVYLYNKDYVNAEAQSTELINAASQYRLETDLNKVFLNTSTEAIWQLLPSGLSTQYTFEGYNFILLAQPTNVALTDALVSSFEANDQRRVNWVRSLGSFSTTYRYAYKYKETSTNFTGVEYSMVMRLAELYLIRAEARVKLGKLIGANSASSDINSMRNRAGLSNIIATTDPEILSALEKEWRIEFFTEWGHRFFDLKRTERLNEVMGINKGSWRATNSLLPIPASEILNNTNLAPQNDGY